MSLGLGLLDLDQNGECIPIGTIMPSIGSVICEIGFYEC